MSDTMLSQVQAAADNAAACGVSFRVLGHTERETTIAEEILIDNVPMTRDLRSTGRILLRGEAGHNLNGNHRKRERD
jgi:hypothetical protein